MDDPSCTLEGLKQKSFNSFLLSERAIRQYPEIHGQLKTVLYRILTGPVDVSEYYGTALEVTELLKPLTLMGGHTIFHYFYQHIDPTQKGDVRYFRAMCKDLADQLEILKSWRAGLRHLRRVK